MDFYYGHTALTRKNWLRCGTGLIGICLLLTLKPSAMPSRATQVYGIDTSVFVRLLTGHPEAEFQATVAAIQAMYEREPAAALVVSNQVIGESYITLQFHYKLSKADAKEGIRKLLSDGMVSPINGFPIIELLQEQGGAGLMDRLIIQDYQERGFAVLTRDKTMAKISGARLLQ